MAQEDFRTLVTRDCERMGFKFELLDVQVDYIDENQNGTFNCCISALVKLYNRDAGNEHQDIGCGIVNNIADRVTALISARRKAIDDGVKRVMRQYFPEDPKKKK
ncbi:DNA repair protein Rad52 [Acrasis kona]|uniref:DNA repair protein Rad52 n=1 Tax=Acrasis kona TaxID=1008807 RepID=A0AAW2ZAR0_9EUKA